MSIVPRRLIISYGRNFSALTGITVTRITESLPSSPSPLKRENDCLHQLREGRQQNFPRSPLLTSTHRRSFYATPKNEIVPFVAAGAAVLLVGRYSWKALNRMDDEWEDYIWRLQQYERERRKLEVEATVTIGVDLGTVYLKLSAITGSQPQLIETSQGDRYRFNGIIQQDNGGDIITGKRALDKFFYDPNDDGGKFSSVSSGVVLPYTLLQGETHDDAVMSVQQIFIPSVGEAMERVGGGNKNGVSTKSNVDGASTTTGMPQTLRTVLTLPPTLYNQHGETFFRNYHDESHQTVTVPEPVATLWGAQVLNIVPTPQSKNENMNHKTLIVDVGGLASTLSIVANDMVVSSVSLDRIGGESYVQTLVKLILSEAGDETMSKDPMSMTMISTNARSSVIELVKKTQSNVVIPFLFMGRRADNPNLEMNISRNVLEQAVTDVWKTSVIPYLVDRGDALSSSLPIPTNVASLFTSAITRVLEDGNVLPGDIHRILVVGGGSKHRLFEDTAREAVFAVLGPGSSDKLVFPETSQRAELCALGASSLLPNFDYDYNNGLERTYL